MLVRLYEAECGFVMYNRMLPLGQQLLQTSKLGNIGHLIS
jgi:hypothetical protein